MKLGLIPMVLLVALTTACAHTKNKSAHKNPHHASYSKEANRTPAQDNTTTELTHVSADSRYIGFFEEVVQDGSGFYSTTFRVLDLVKDKYIFDKRILSGDPESMTEAEQAKAPAEQRKDLLLLAKSVISSTKMGTTNLKPTANFSTLDKPDGNYYNEGLTQKGNFTISGKTHSFEITTTKAGTEQVNKAYHVCLLDTTDDGSSVKMYTLKVNNKVAHQDSRVPRSRGCVNAYGVDKIYNLSGKVLFFVRYRTMGFEGPDFKTITVPMDYKDL